MSQASWDQEPTWRQAQVNETIEHVLVDPATHFWLRAALQSALTKDPADALHDARTLYLLLKERWDAIVEASNNTIRHESSP